MFYTNNGENWNYISNSTKFEEKLPVGNYTLSFSPFSKFYLSTTDQFSIPEKIYGNKKELSEYYLNNYNKLNCNVGIILNGVKGTGKSLIAHKLCVDSNLPVIIIRDNFCKQSSNFIDFIGKLPECVIFIDEFEKIYSSIDDQKIFLNLLDGTFKNKKLFVFTMNDLHVNEFFLNRLKRIRYYEKFEDLNEQEIREVLEDHSVEESKIIDTIMCLEEYNISTYDILLTLVEEFANNPDIPIKTIIDRLSLSRERGSYWDYTVFTADGKKVANSFFTGKRSIVNFDFYIKDDYYEIELDLSTYDKENSIPRKGQYIYNVEYENQAFKILVEKRSFINPKVNNTFYL